ncbi:ABC transporter permease [Sphingomonas bacterium]|uniref:ABC transporter permease n=1 Tax=Sphingomonas bacterium TaxID=1895847 RepID=UPI001574FBC5|nr:ABC transporter permease [Sphingomonas bacterium]
MSRRFLLLLPALLILVLLVALPYLNIILISMRPSTDDGAYGSGFTFANYMTVLASAYSWRQIGTTLQIGFITTAAALLLGCPVAWNLARSPGRSQALRNAIVLSPMLVSIVVRSYGWTILLGNNGVINRAARALGLTTSVIPLMYNQLGIIIALTHVFLPFMILPIRAQLQKLDPTMEQAGLSLGASRRTVFWRIILPLVMPGVQTDCVIVFILSISAYVTPVLLGGMQVKTMPMTVVDTLIDSFRWPLGAAQALILAVCGGLIVLVFLRLTPLRWNRP